MSRPAMSRPAMMQRAVRNLFSAGCALTESIEDIVSARPNAEAGGDIDMSSRADIDQLGIPDGRPSSAPP